MNCKMYTTIEESRWLLELGVNKNSADMIYPSNPQSEKGVYDVPSFKIAFSTDECRNDGVHCWSAEALARLLPDKVENDYRVYKRHIISENGGRYSVEYLCVSNCGSYRTGLVSTRIYDNLIDAFYEAVLILTRKGIMLSYGTSETCASEETPTILDSGESECDCGTERRFYTTVKEADELVRLGLDPRTADMYYPVEDDRWQVLPLAMRWSELSDVVRDYTKPCWSLAGLLSQIKPVDGCSYSLAGTPDGGAAVAFEGVTSSVFRKADPFDAVYSMLKSLLETDACRKRGRASEITRETLLGNGFLPCLGESGDKVYQYERRGGDGVVKIVLTDGGDGAWSLEAFDYDKFTDREKRVTMDRGFLKLSELNNALGAIGIEKRITNGAE